LTTDDLLANQQAPDWTAVLLEDFCPSVVCVSAVSSSPYFYESEKDHAVCLVEEEVAWREWRETGDLVSILRLGS
jgi:hypothetical protein